MRRVLIMMAVSAIAVLTSAGTANAARGQTFHLSFHGKFAEALWETSTPNTVTDTYTIAQSSKAGDELFVDQFTEAFDAQGNFTGATDTFADVTSGFSFGLAARLKSAQVSAGGIPATSCTYDQDFNLIGCSDTTLSEDASWTGVGPIAHETFHDHFRSDGFSENDHFNGTARNATATGTIGGISLSTDSLAFADMGTAKSGSSFLCIGNSC
jgi:hypothetical protein